MPKTKPLAVRGIILLICALTLAGCFGGGGGGQPQAYGSLDGYVYVTTGNARSIGVRGLEEDIEDQTSKPLSGAAVSIGGRTGTTDSNGYFNIASIPVGTYTVSISASSYQTLSIPGVAITQDQTTHLSYRNLSFPRKAWNFLVYLDGDNSLEQAAIMDVNEMEQIGSTDRVNVLVLIDRIDKTHLAPQDQIYDDTSNGDWTDTRLYYITKDADTSIINSTLLAALGERDMSDPATLRDFLVYCQGHFPADRTCLTLWNHGGGVYPRSVRPPEMRSAGSSAGLEGGMRGICWDDTTGGGAWDCLTTDEAAQALSQARAQTSQKIDVINMDACLTQMLEVAYEWRNETGYLAGSEEIVPGNGNDYAAVLRDLTANPGMDARTLAATLVNDYYNYYRSTTENTTYSAIGLGTEFNTLVKAFAGFATAMKNTGDLDSAYTAWCEATHFISVVSNENTDLYSYADRVSYYTTDPAIDISAAILKTAIGNAVVTHKETGSHVGHAYGLGILLPDPETWEYYRGGYSDLALSQITDWNEFIEIFVNRCFGDIGDVGNIEINIQ